MLKHREIIGQGSHQTEPGVLPGQSPIMVRVYPTTRCQARRHQALGCQWGPGNQRALLWKPIFISLFFFFIHLLCLQLFSLSLWMPHSSALLDFRVWLWKRSDTSCGTQDRSRNVSSGPFPNYPHFVKLTENAVMALLWKGSFEWQFVLWLLIYFSFSCWSHDWLLLPAPTHAVRCRSATAFLTFHCMQPHNFYHCEMLWRIGSEEKSV